MDAKSHNLKMYPSHYTYSQSGMNITLTIDKRIQDVLERELSNAYDTYHPDGIWALAMNPKNGEILESPVILTLILMIIKMRIKIFIIKIFQFGKLMNQDQPLKS